MNILSPLFVSISIRIRFKNFVNYFSKPYIMSALAYSCIFETIKNLKINVKTSKPV